MRVHPLAPFDFKWVFFNGDFKNHFAPKEKVLAILLYPSAIIMWLGYYMWTKEFRN